MPNYREQYDKIIQAYFRDEIEICDSEFCFCGTLSPTGRKWNTSPNFSWGKDSYQDHKYDHPQPYTLSEYKRMEWALVDTKNDYAAHNGIRSDHEDAIFMGMSAALEVLKQIHISRGEKIDEDIPQFTKRELSTNKTTDNVLSTS